MATTELSTEVRGPEEELSPEDEARMTFIEHLTELRDRLVKAGIAMIVGVVLCYAGSDYIYEFIKQPLTPMAAKIREATPQEGLFLAHLAQDGSRQWSEELGEYLQGAVPAGMAPYPDGRLGIVANRTTTEERPEGILVELKPREEVDEGPVYEVDKVQLWRGAKLSFVAPSAGGSLVLHTLVPDLENPEIEVVDVVVNGEKVAEFEKSIAVSDEGNMGGGQWTILSPLEWFFVKIKLAAYFGVALSLPFVLWQACGFVFPGLKSNERQLVRILLGGCALFALMGVGLSYALVFPLVLPYLLEWTPTEVLVTFRMNETIDLILKGLVAFGIAFQMPMVVLVLVWLDIITPATLTQYRRVAIVIMTVGAAILTPPDPASLVMLLLPLWLLYELSIVMARIVVFRRKRRQDAEAQA